MHHPDRSDTAPSCPTRAMAITGATGFIGGAIATAAALKGWDVVRFGLHIERASGGARRWDLATGPLTPAPQVDVVVHCAAAVTDWGGGAAQRVTVEGTRAVADTFPAARLVHISTGSVYDPALPTVMATEAAAPVDSYRSAYAAAKADAERILQGRPDTVILRPHAVYGPGDRTLLPRVLAGVQGRTLLLPGSAGVRASLTHIDGLVQAVLLAADPACTNGRDVPAVYNIADAEPVVLDEVLAQFLRARGVDARIRHLPLALAAPVALAAEFIWRVLRRPRPPRLTRYALEQLAVERTLDITKAVEELGYQPMATDLSAAADW